MMNEKVAPLLLLDAASKHPTTSKSFGKLVVGCIEADFSSRYYSSLHLENLPIFLVCGAARAKPEPCRKEHLGLTAARSWSSSACAASARPSCARRQASAVLAKE